MTQIFVSSRLFGAMSLAAAIDAGHFGPSGRRRILLISHDAQIPELTPPPNERPGYAPLLSRFDEVISLNELIDPLHPLAWSPAAVDQPMIERLLRRVWNLGDEPIELAVEAIQSNPARSLASIFHDATVTVYSDGLATYGATRATPPTGVGSRLSRLLYLDLMPGLVPHLLAEYDAPAEELSGEAFLKVIEEVTAEVEPILAGHGEFGDNVALIVGQYFSELEILTDEEENRLHLEMLQGVVARGHDTVLFKPHPHSPPRLFELLVDEAKRLDARLVVIDDPVPAETWCARVRPALIVGICSTAMMTAYRYYGVPAATVGTELLLERLTPYQNSNRIPVTIVDAALPHLEPDGTLRAPMIGAEAVSTELTSLVAAVAYCMRAAARPDLRPAAQDYLRDHVGGPMARYFKRRRLTMLGLPGGVHSPRTKALNTVLPRSSRRRRLAVNVVRRAEQLRARPKDDA
ncbi:alpha-2,8-polysialyltransferase family protein [Thermomonospora umbrina]|uniref:Uncharacterized protein n=1 Tax=Thermomonospora umbrina TaxID=111806 RepID=A0A3D9T0R0_9ACTN|nr:alpha-2,8-polysialyltransferase family protein [Thermomonospora umbrina]REE98384.1 hypothetical protein DFJ69_3871 [Thermomonospora umbrina]